MNVTRPHSGRHTVDGTLKVFAAELMIVPSGLLIAAYLTRVLGPAGYGLFILAVTLVVWVEFTITGLMGRAAIKFVSAADDWKPVAATIIRLHLILSVTAAGLLALLAGPIAQLMSEPELAGYLRLFSIDIPLFALAKAHRNIAVGLGGFTQRALASAGRWTSRLVLVVGLVHLGLDIHGAIIGSLLASLVELTIYRFFTRPPLLGSAAVPVRQLWGYMAPLFLYVLSLRLFDKMDLILLKGLGGTTEQVGFFGAAQNLSLMPIIFAGSFSPLLLSTISRRLSLEDAWGARRMGRRAMRRMLCMIPFAAMTVGCSTEIVTVFFGQKFASTAPLLAILIFAGVARAIIAVDTAILTAAGKPSWTFLIAGPMLLLAVAGHVVMIPIWGPIGAATVTATTACLAAIASGITVHYSWNIKLPIATLVRCALVGGLAYGAGVYWPLSSAIPLVMLMVKLSAIACMIVVSLFLLGEFEADDMTLIRSVLLAYRPAIKKASRS